MWTNPGLSRAALATPPNAWLSPEQSTGWWTESMKKSAAAPSYFHLHLVSDATGETLLAVGRAAAAQYATVSPIEHVYPLVQNQKQLDAALTEIEQNPGIDPLARYGLYIFVILSITLMSNISETPFIYFQF
jgi:hypothetical protein